MEQTILLFEDEGYQSLLPLTYTRTAADIRCGVYTLRERLHISTTSCENYSSNTRRILKISQRLRKCCIE
jgi:hypothetical protein